jgi:hypothetical protein
LSPPFLFPKTDETDVLYSKNHKGRSARVHRREIREKKLCWLRQESTFTTEPHSSCCTLDKCLQDNPKAVRHTSETSFTRTNLITGAAYMWQRLLLKRHGVHNGDGPVIGPAAWYLTGGRIVMRRGGGCLDCWSREVTFYGWMNGFGVPS